MRVGHAFCLDSAKMHIHSALTRLVGNMTYTMHDSNARVVIAAQGKSYPVGALPAVPKDHLPVVLWHLADNSQC